MKNPRKLAQFSWRNGAIDEFEDVSSFLGQCPSG
jgi:hypothetical protein